MFTIVPVLDIRHRRVVRARAGDRAQYAPIATPLAPGSEPAVILAGLARLHPFRAYYVADLDGIEQGRPNLDLVAALAAAVPDAELWVDAGIADAAAARRLAEAGAGRVLIGSESAPPPRLALDLVQEGHPVALSLDFRGDDFVGPAALIDDAALWPDVVVVMTLARVGTSRGPDFAKLDAIRRRAGNRRVFAAGGVRGPDDLAALATAGIDGVLVASALHDGALTAADLAAFG